MFKVEYIRPYTPDLGLWSEHFVWYQSNEHRYVKKKNQKTHKS